jgi:Fe-S-cluster-containing dehydrogenase component
MLRSSRIAGAYADLAWDSILGTSMHCANPFCVVACPTGANYQRDDSLVLIEAGADPRGGCC